MTDMPHVMEKPYKSNGEVQLSILAKMPKSSRSLKVKTICWENVEVKRKSMNFYKQRLNQNGLLPASLTIVQITGLKTYRAASLVTTIGLALPPLSSRCHMHSFVMIL